MDSVQLVTRGSGLWGIRGKLTFDTVPALVNRYSDLLAGNPGVIIDLNEVELADSAGLALLVEWTVVAEKSHQKLTFSNIPIQILAMARVSGLDEILPIYIKEN